MTGFGVTEKDIAKGITNVELNVKRFAHITPGLMIFLDADKILLLR